MDPTVGEMRALVGMMRLSLPLQQPIMPTTGMVTSRLMAIGKVAAPCRPGQRAANPNLDGNAASLIHRHSSTLRSPLTYPLD